MTDLREGRRPYPPALVDSMTTTNGRDQRRGHPDDAALVNESAASTPAPGSASDPPTPAVGRVAFHESAHATLAERLGVGVVNVTMRPPRTYMGPLEHRDRDAIEARIVAVLAGGVADLYTRRTSGYLPDVTRRRRTPSLSPPSTPRSRRGIGSCSRPTQRARTAPSRSATTPPRWPCRPRWSGPRPSCTSPGWEPWPSGWCTRPGPPSCAWPPCWSSTES